MFWYEATCTDWKATVPTSGGSHLGETGKKHHKYEKNALMKKGS